MAKLIMLVALGGLFSHALAAQPGYKEGREPDPRPVLSADPTQYCIYGSQLYTIGARITQGNSEMECALAIAPGTSQSRARWSEVVEDTGATGGQGAAAP